MIYIFVPFLADYDQNHMQIISLKKTSRVFASSNHSNFRNISRSCAIFIFNKTCRSSLRTLNVLYLFLNVRIPCATSIYSSCGLTKARQACCFTFSGHLLKFFLIKPLKRSVGFAYNSSNLDHWISQLQGICGDQQLPRVLRGWCVAQYFPFFLEQGLLIEHVLAMFLNQELF